MAKNTILDTKAREFARSADSDVLRLEVQVLWVRSSDQHIHLTSIPERPTEPSISGWVRVSDQRMFAIMAAAQAAGRSAYAEVRAHDPHAAGGAGRFAEMLQAALQMDGLG
ncbi:MAG: hypothetical protein M5U28_37395 [Sandaracinaceae bacterium]|nr:hypothetical protein [Sandaracinaceae bacterium]